MRRVRKKKRAVRGAKLATRYAHRGYHDKPLIPENSMAAFRRAVEHGLAAELDLHLLTDGTLVVFHDSKLERETGVEGIIEDYDLSNLSKLRLEGTNEHIPTFKEVLDLYEDSGLELLIEPKCVNRNHKALAAAMAESLKDYKGKYAVQSFDPRVLVAFRKLMPEVAIGQLSVNYFKKSNGRIMVLLAKLTNLLFHRWVKPDFVSYKLKDKKNRLLRRSIRRKGLGQAAWTIKSVDAYKAALKGGRIPIFEKLTPEEVESLSEDNNGEDNEK